MIVARRWCRQLLGFPRSWCARWSGRSRLVVALSRRIVSQRVTNNQVALFTVAGTVEAAPRGLAVRTFLGPTAIGGHVTDASIPVIRVPTTWPASSDVGPVNGEEDLRVVKRLQAALTLTPTTSGRPLGLPRPTPPVPEDLSFFEQLRVSIAALPPVARDLDYQARFEPLGLLEADSLESPNGPALTTCTIPPRRPARSLSPRR
jgi:hypothetical protein